MQQTVTISHHHPDQPTRWWTRFGIAGLTFFFVKGLLWLLVPVLFTLWR
jgi:hypothetical protein